MLARFQTINRGEVSDNIATLSAHFETLLITATPTQLGTRTICQHCYGNNRGFKAGSHNRLWNAAMRTFLVHNDGV